MIYVPVVKKKKIIAYRTNSAERTIEACHSIFLEHGNIRMNNRILEKKNNSENQDKRVFGKTT